jgi:tetratricopeptide (TPR) repeat protein
MCPKPKMPKKNISHLQSNLKSSITEQLFQKGLAYHQRGQFNEALEVYYQILEINPKHFDALQLIATLFLQCKKYNDSLNFFKSALKIKSNFVPALINYGNVLKELKNFDEALKNYDKAIRLEPNNVGAYNNRGNILKDLKRYDEALKNYDVAIQLKPDYAEAYNNRGSLLNDLKRFDEAIISLNKAIQLKPDYAEPISNKAYLKLLLGEYKEGWLLHESRKNKKDRINDYPKFPAPLWLGDASIEGKTLLVHSEQGLGDTLQFCRYLPMLQSFKPKEIIFYVEKSLISILSSMDNEITLIEKNQPLPSFDYYCPLLSLPLAFKTTIETIPANIPYLKVDDVKNTYWQDQLGKQTKPRIGLVWSGSTKHKNDHNRSLMLTQLSSVLALPFEFHSLQKDIRDGDNETLQTYKNLNQHQDNLHDFSDTAALINQMDLIISVDTSVAHLAGALGKQVWILLPFMPDFRWLLDRDDSPWYPTTKLFRQPQIGDWDSVIQQLISELNTLFSK